MDKKEILEFINKNPICYLASIDGGVPRVRPIGTFSADEGGIVFSFQNDKDVYKQLVKNPAVELCYHAEGATVRVNGRLEESKDQALRERIFEKRPFLKPGIDRVGWDYVGVFILKRGRASFIDPKAPPGSPKKYMDL